jgi:hypothetical protein
MPLRNYQSPSMASRAVIAAGGMVLLVSAVLQFSHSNSRQTNPTDQPTSPVPSTADRVESGEAPLTPRDEVVARLREILRIREEAYRFRDPELLRTVYSNDCPCLASDEKAIYELLEREHRWVGIATSIDVRSAKRIGKRIWVVVALLHSDRLQIETSSGAPVHVEPAGVDLFQFTLVMPRDSQQWLLGLAAILEAKK